MFLRIDTRILPTSEALLACDASTASQPQLSQEVLQGAAYRLRDPE
jgi:hypothetical protein